MQNIKKLAALIRVQDWSTSKLLFHFSAILVMCVPGVKLYIILAALGSIAAWAAFGYAINNFADYEADTIAGKKNTAGDVSQKVVLFFLAVLALLSLGLALIWIKYSAIYTLLITGLFLSGTYSLKPFRIKERGILGILTGSLCQWALPVLVLSALSSNEAYVAPLCILGLSMGVRWMTIHQIQDKNADIISGIHTYVTDSGKKTWIILYVALSAELASIVWLILQDGPARWPACVSFILWCVQEIVFSSQKGLFASRLQSYNRVPLSEYYFFFLPIALLISKIYMNPYWMIFLPGVLIINWCYFQMMQGDFFNYLSTRK